MLILITDDRIQGDTLAMEIRNDKLDEMEESPQLDRDEAFKVIEFWESSTEVGSRGSYDLTEDGIIVLAEVTSTGDDVEMMAWYVGDVNDYVLESFPSSTLHWEIVKDEVPEPEPKQPKKFGELRSYPGMNGIPVTEGD